MKRINSIIFIVITFFSIALNAEELSVTGIYGDIHFNESSGDLLGVEVFLMKGKDTYYVLFQSAQGDLENPILVKATVIKNELTFNLPKSNTGYTGAFRGTISLNKIEGGFSNGQLSSSGEKIFKLKKGNSYWQ